MRGFGTLLLAFVIAGGLLAFDAWTRLNRPLALETPQTVMIAPGTPLTQVVADWQQRGWIDHYQAIYGRLYARATGLATQIQAGEYRLQPGHSLRAVLALLVSGKVVLHELTLVEGWRFDQALALIRRDPALKQTLTGQSAEQIMSALGHAGQHPEGRFLPETYRYPAGTTDLEFLRRAYAAMSEALAQAWAGRAADLPLESPDQALVLASIIERETGVPDERAQIAGVFVRRLRLGMRLQTDPTVLYGLGPDFQGRLRTRHLREDTAYNTYTRSGLPPTPICLPGRAALHAALHPADGKALYFVSKNDGSHQFSATLEEHQAAVRKYQLGQGG